VRRQSYVPFVTQAPHTFLLRGSNRTPLIDHASNFTPRSSALRSEMQDFSMPASAESGN